MAHLAHRMLVAAEQLGDAAVGEAAGLQLEQLVAAQAGQRTAFEFAFDAHQLVDLREEPRIDRRFFVDLLDRHAQAERVGQKQDALGARLADLLHDLFFIAAAFGEAVDAGFQAPQRLLKAFLERAADRHHLAHRFHLRGEMRIGLAELLEREARDLGNDVVDRRLEARGN
jgi:hypothetical protein